MVKKLNNCTIVAKPFGAIIKFLFVKKKKKKLKLKKKL